MWLISAIHSNVNFDARTSHAPLSRALQNFIKFYWNPSFFADFAFYAPHWPGAWVFTPQQVAQTAHVLPKQMQHPKGNAQ